MVCVTAVLPVEMKRDGEKFVASYNDKKGRCEVKWNRGMIGTVMEIERERRMRDDEGIGQAGEIAMGQVWIKILQRMLCLVVAAKKNNHELGS